MFGGTNKLEFVADPIINKPESNCRGVRVSVNLKPELSILSTVAANLTTIVIISTYKYTVFSYKFNIMN